MTYSPQFLRHILGPVRRGARQREWRARTQMLLPRDAVAPGCDVRERRAGAEVEICLDALAEARRRRAVAK